MYEHVFKMRKDSVLTESLKFGAGPAPLPTPVLEKGAAVRISLSVLSLLHQTSSPGICSGNAYYVDVFGLLHRSSTDIERLSLIMRARVWDLLRSLTGTSGNCLVHIQAVSSLVLCFEKKTLT